MNYKPLIAALALSLGGCANYSAKEYMPKVEKRPTEAEMNGVIEDLRKLIDRQMPFFFIPLHKDKDGSGSEHQPLKDDNDATGPGIGPR